MSNTDLNIFLNIYESDTRILVQAKVPLNDSMDS